MLVGLIALIWQQKGHLTCNKYYHNNTHKFSFVHQFNPTCSNFGQWVGKTDCVCARKLKNCIYIK